MPNTFDTLNPLHMDVLKEIGNIGAGNAATSLSMMLDMPVDMDLPLVNLLDFSTVADSVGGPENLVYGVLVELHGEVEGIIMFLLDKVFAHRIVNILLGGVYENFEEMDDIALSAIRELGNILSCAYINSLAELTGLTITPTTPSVAIDMAGALLSVPIIKFGALGDQVLYIEETFKGRIQEVVSRMIMFTEVESLNLILSKLGIT